MAVHEEGGVKIFPFFLWGKENDRKHLWKSLICRVWRRISGKITFPSKEGSKPQSRSARASSQGFMSDHTSSTDITSLFYFIYSIFSPIILATFDSYLKHFRARARRHVVARAAPGWGATWSARALRHCAEAITVASRAARALDWQARWSMKNKHDKALNAHFFPLLKAFSFIFFPHLRSIKMSDSAVNKNFSCSTLKPWKYTRRKRPDY